MRLFSRGLALGLSTIFLVQCSGSPSNGDQPLILLSAKSGARWAATFLGEAIGQPKVRPGALIGMYASHHLLHAVTLRGAVRGVFANLDLMFDPEEEKIESFALLEEMGTLLQINVPDLLNRSTSRSASFEAYLEGLEDAITTGEQHRQKLEQQLDEVYGERRAQRREASQIQSELNIALRSQDYGTAGGLQEQLIEAEGALAEVQAREDEKRSIISLFEELLEVALERRDAMIANREAILAGITVVELPGIDDLGILEQGGRGSRNRDSRGFIDLDGI